MKQRAPLIFLCVLLASLLPMLVQVAWPFVTSFILAAVTAIVVNPVKEWLSRRTHRPALATFATTLATVSILGGVFAGGGFTITQELRSTYESLNRSSLEKGGWPAMVTDASDRVVDALARRIPIDKEAIRTELLERMKTASGYLLSHIDVALGGMTTTVLTAFLVTVFLYYLLRHGGVWLARLAAMTPLNARTADSIIHAAHDSVVANVNGVLAAVVGQGLFLILGFWMFGVRAPVLWGMLGGLASVIPVVGAPLIWVPVAIALLVTGSYWKALMLGLWCALVVGSIDNLLRPFVVGTRENLHPVIIALAAIGGTYAFGALGILLGPLSVSLVAALLKEVQRLIPPSGATDDRSRPVSPEIAQNVEHL